MNADEGQLRKINSNLIERDRPPDAGQNAVALVAQTVTDLHHDRHLKFTALGVNRIISSLVGRPLEPVGVQMHTDKAVLANALLQLTQAAHAQRRICPGYTREAVRIFLADIRHPFIRDGKRACNPHVTGSDRNQERALNACSVHFFQIFFDRHPVANVLGKTQLGHERLVNAGLPQPDFLFGKKITDNINRALSSHRPILLVS